MQTKGATQALQFLEAAIANFEAAQGERLRTRDALERLSARYFWRSVEGFCQEREAAEPTISNEIGSAHREAARWGNDGL